MLGIGNRGLARVRRGAAAGIAAAIGVWSATGALGASPAEVAAVQDRMRSYIEAYVEGTGLEPSAVGQAKLLSEARRRYERGAYDEAEIQAWIHKELDEVFYAFGKPYAKHDPGARYRLPFDVLVPRMVSQGIGDAPYHDRPITHYAYDFVMPAGSQVMAARRGIVSRVVDGLPVRKDDASRANAVYVLHPDGPTRSTSTSGKASP